MRLMSFRLTIEQFKDRSKDVTRRMGWGDLRPGDRLMGVEQAMGLKLGETVSRLGEIEVVSMRIEPLYLADAAEVAREGFPYMAPEEFVEMFCRANRCRPDTMVTRIEYRYCEEVGPMDICTKHRKQLKQGDEIQFYVEDGGEIYEYTGFYLTCPECGFEILRTACNHTGFAHHVDTLPTDAVVFEEDALR